MGNDVFTRERYDVCVILSKSVKCALKNGVLWHVVDLIRHLLRIRFRLTSTSLSTGSGRNDEEAEGDRQPLKANTIAVIPD